MARSMWSAMIFLAAAFSPSAADEIAWGDVAADGSLNLRSLDVAVPKARGAEVFFVDNPMESWDWSHTATVRKSFFATFKAKGSQAHSAKIASLEESLRPVFAALPKDEGGRLNNGTARYALHRLFIEKHGWSVKGLQPAGAGWMSSLSVTPDVKDLNKYMVPTYMQDLLSAELGVSGFDLHSLAILAATIEHLVLAEMKSIVYSSITTLGMPIKGKRTEPEVAEILDTFMMVYVFGLNLDSSMLKDVQKAKAHLERSHSGWHQLQAFAQEVRKNTFASEELDFNQLVQLVMKIGEGYAQWQGKDCARVKEELSAKPSHREGQVMLSEVRPVHTPGRRSLFTESPEDLTKLGALSSASGPEAQIIIPNYINSQSMCLSTASFYAACCVNECEGLLAKLERQVAAPEVEPTQLARLLTALPGPGLSEALVGELQILAGQGNGLVALHGRGLAAWMHRAFPLECPAPHSQKVTNPMTPDEWMGESGLEVAALEEMMAEIAHVSSQYTTMGKAQEVHDTGIVRHFDVAYYVATDTIVLGKQVSTTDEATDEATANSNTDVVTILTQHGPTNVDQVSALMQGESRWNLSGMVFGMFGVAALASITWLVADAAKSGYLATSTRKGKVMEDYGMKGCV